MVSTHWKKGTPWIKILQQKELAEGWTPTVILNNSLPYRARSPKGNSYVSYHLFWPLGTWQGDMWHLFVSACRHFSKNVNILRAGSITSDITEEQNNNHLSAVQNHSNMVILTDPWWSHVSLPELILLCTPVQWRAVLTHRLPQEADAKPEASKHRYHEHLMFTLQCVDASPMQVGSTVLIVWGNQDLL